MAVVTGVGDTVEFRKNLGHFNSHLVNLNTECWSSNNSGHYPRVRRPEDFGGVSH